MQFASCTSGVIAPGAWDALMPYLQRSQATMARVRLSHEHNHNLRYGKTPPTRVLVSLLVINL